MKKLYILSALALAGVALTGCDDFLDDNRYPLSQQVVNASFWNNSVNVQNQVNYFYEDYLGYGNATGSGAFYFTTLSDDQCGRTSMTNWNNQNVPTASSNWSGPYTEIRRANLIIAGVEGSTLSENEKANFIAQARMHRARQYFDLVKKYGDVPLVDRALDPADTEELYGPRIARNTVMDFVLADINYAVDNIALQSSKTEFSKDLAQAVKAEICLYEGSYARYHQKDDARAKTWFGYVVTAGEAIAARYPMCSDYTSLYKSFRTAGGGYDGLTNNQEVIFMKAYEKDVLMHSTGDYSSASDGIAGITRDAFDSFLMLNGTLATGDAGVFDADTKTVSIANLLEVRDQRLAMTTYDHLIFHGCEWAGPNTAPMWSMTGYGVAKYDNWTLSNSDNTTANKQYNCAPLFWGARLYLAILEAKAELGTLSDADLTTYMKPLWDRAGFTVAPTLALLNGINDPANHDGVSSLLWEIRRCRRNELMMDDGIRYWDLVRWHRLEKISTDRGVAAVFQGANVTMVPEVNLNSDNKGGYLDCTYGQSRLWEDRQYLYPIPSDQIGLNEELTQNPGW